MKNIKDRTQELIELYNAEDSSNELKNLYAEEIIILNEKLILYLIRKHYISYIESHIEDMMQEGKIAILINFKRYDAKKGKFSTFITPYIVNQIKCYISSIHEISTYYFAQIKKFYKALKYLEISTANDNNIDEIALQMGVGEKAVKNVINVDKFKNKYSLDERENGEIVDRYNIDPANFFCCEERKNFICEAVESFAYEERAIIKSIITLELKNYSVNKIADSLNMSVEAVKLAKVNIANRLKNILKYA